FTEQKRIELASKKSNTKENEGEVKKSNTAKSVKTSSSSISTFSSWKNSIVHFRTSVTIGSNDVLRNVEPVKNALVNHFEGLKIFKVHNPFERRVTSIACHPIYTNYVVAGSKGGELILCDLNSPRTVCCPGVGPGGSIVGLKFNINDPSLVYTASITGNVKEENLTDQSKSKTFLSSGTFEKLIFSGDCRGNAYLITTAGQSVWPKSKKLHCDKISHVEFHPRDPNVFVTASIDHSVKLWDLRMMGDPDSKGRYHPTEIFPHLKGVNSAYFSPSNGCSLLTTDQHSELRVYSCENWKKFKVIPHPHRQFQHLTPVKATWFPLADIVVAGRYPDDNFQQADSRTIDFFDGSTGNVLYRKDSKLNKIHSLNVFNSSGDAMISATGASLLLWKKEECYASSDSCLPCSVSGTRRGERGRRPALNKKFWASLCGSINSDRRPPLF
ncbi:DNA damage-binding protein 2-like, partial [Uloborus diversus]|uniref:DNA damage-binding protein 2-like n=1 Tax=Uloborus diversus TaxID=327109 RepID=UPI0024095AC2